MEWQVLKSLMLEIENKLAIELIKLFSVGVDLVMIADAQKPKYIII